jgi:hypothetical protein
VVFDDRPVKVAGLAVHAEAFAIAELVEYRTCMVTPATVGQVAVNPLVTRLAQVAGSKANTTESAAKADLID